MKRSRTTSETSSNKRFHATITLPLDIVDRIFSFFSPRDLMVVRILCKYHRDFAERLLYRLIDVRGYHSPNVDLLDIIRVAVGSVPYVRISADQITSHGLIDDIVPNRGKIRGLIAGRDEKYVVRDRRGSIVIPSEYGYGSSSKMHNKFWLLGGLEVISGSPNLSVGGIRDNIEGIIHIKSPLVATVFRHYFEVLQLMGDRRSSWRVEEAMTVARKALMRFNAGAGWVRLALAPLLGIGDFIIGELDKTHEANNVSIVVRQFMIDAPRQGNLVEKLGTLARSGARVEVVLDFGQYCQNDFMKRAGTYLRSKGVRVHLQQRRPTRYSEDDKIMHDKLLLISYDKDQATMRTVITGSAGLTQNVMNNDNWENMFAIDQDSLFEYFLERHERTFEGVWNIYSKELE